MEKLKNQSILGTLKNEGTATITIAGGPLRSGERLMQITNTIRYYLKRIGEVEMKTVPCDDGTMKLKIMLLKD